jgi:hypothetical protein
MYRIVIGCILLMMSTFSSAHQFTPTYPVFEPSFVEGIVGTKLELFNKRKDVSYYEIGVYNAEWKPVSFASEDKLFYIKYLETKKINVYLKQQDLSTAVYICSESRIRKEDVIYTAISSKICSKIKR